MQKKKLVFDLEFVGEDFDTFDDVTKHDLAKNLPDKELEPTRYQVEYEAMKNKLVFSPLTGKIITIGVYDPDNEKGAVYYDTEGTDTEEREEDGIKYVPMTEPEMLTKFWALAEVHDEFITFFGRRSDVPYMMIRSAIHGIRPTRDLTSNRYNNLGAPSATHYDVSELLTFNGLAMYKGSLHRWCRAFGIETPKTDDMGGDKVGQAFKDGKYFDIAKYNSLDLKSTAALYAYWERYFKPQM